LINPAVLVNDINQEVNSSPVIKNSKAGILDIEIDISYVYITI
jgi:hypothetical protein